MSGTYGNGVDDIRARQAEEAMYEQVAAEMAARQIKKGLWAKALSSSDGSAERAKPLYIKLRVRALMDEESMKSEPEKLYTIEPARKADEERRQRELETVRQVEIERRHTAELERQRIRDENLEKEAKEQARKKKFTIIVHVLFLVLMGGSMVGLAIEYPALWIVAIVYFLVCGVALWKYKQSSKISYIFSFFPLIFGGVGFTMWGLRGEYNGMPAISAPPASSQPANATPANIDAQVDEYGNTALMLAILDGDSERVKRLLAAGANISATDSEGFTALHIAAIKGEVEIVSLLINAGAYVNLRARKGGALTALMLSSVYGHAEVVRRLIKAGADVNMESVLNINGKKSMVTALDYAEFYASNPQIVRQWADEGKPIAFEHREIIQILRAAGARE